MSVASSYLVLGSQRIGTDWAMLCSLVSLVRQKFLLEEISKPRAAANRGRRNSNSPVGSRKPSDDRELPTGVPAFHGRFLAGIRMRAGARCGASALNTAHRAAAGDSALS